MIKLFTKKQTLDQPLCRCCEHALAAAGAPPDPDLGPVCNPCGVLLYRADQMLRRVEGFGPCRPIGPDSGKGVLS